MKKFNKVILPIFVMILLLVSMDAHVAQNPAKPETSPTSRARMPEPEKETLIRNSLAELLVGEGVRVPGTLPLSQGPNYKEIRVRWESAVTSVKGDVVSLEKRPTLGALTRLRSTKRSGTLPRERSFELSSNQILIIALNQSGELRWWTLMLDPRLVRAERPQPTGETAGEDYYLPTVDFIVNYPDDAAIEELRFYHPLWTGKTFQLELLTTLPVD